MEAREARLTYQARWHRFNYYPEACFGIIRLIVAIVLIGIA
jgi:hypothetical protein